jgi:hypothetical protein
MSIVIKMSNNNSSSSSSAIKVVARFRPPNALELAQGGETIVSFETEDTLALDVKGVDSLPVDLADSSRAIMLDDIRLRLTGVLI